MREGSRRSTGLLSVYYYPLSAPSVLSPCPWSAPRPTDAGYQWQPLPFSLQQPILLYPFPLRPTTSSYSLPPPSFSYYTRPPFLSPLLLYYHYFPPLPIPFFYLQRPYPLKRRPCARVRCAHGATKQKGGIGKIKVVIKNNLLSLYNHFYPFLSPFFFSFSFYPLIPT